MAAKEEFEVDHVMTTPGTSFSQLLFGDDDDDDVQKAFAFGVDQTYNNNNNNNNNNLVTNSSVFSIHNTPKMLCFGSSNINYQNEGDLITPQKSIITSSDNNSSSASSCNNNSFNSLPMSNSLQKKRNGSGQQPGTTANVGSQKPPKKTKAVNPTSTGHAKRKEKLGERIAALQQLVSPFGKTDTASVLHEATGYIRFLQDQVQVLCSPYLQRLPGVDGENDGGEEMEKDLRSRGLCLIPVSCTVHVASTNGADFWSPVNNVSHSTKQ